MFYDVDFIYHEGVKRRSGRYPYGSGEKWGKKKNDTGENNKSTKSEMTKKERENFRNKLLKSDNAGKIAANSIYFSDDELRTIASRMQSIATIRQYTPKESNKVKDFFSHVNNLAEYVGVAAKLCNNVMKIANAGKEDPKKDKNKK